MVPAFVVIPVFVVVPGVQLEWPNGALAGALALPAVVGFAALVLAAAPGAVLPWAWLAVGAPGAGGCGGGGAPAGKGGGAPIPKMEAKKAAAWPIPGTAPGAAP